MVGARPSSSAVAKSEMTPEYGDDGILPRAEHVEVADRDGLEAVEPGEHLQILLAHQLLQRVRRERIRSASSSCFGQRRRVAVGRRRPGEDEALDAGVARGDEDVQRGVDVRAIRGERIVRPTAAPTESPPGAARIDAVARPVARTARSARSPSRNSTPLR